MSLWPLLPVLVSPVPVVPVSPEPVPVPGTLAQVGVPGAGSLTGVVVVLGSVAPGQLALCTETLAPVQAPSWALTAALSAAFVLAAAATLRCARTCEWWAA